jgi:BatD DUF11 like domain
MLQLPGSVNRCWLSAWRYFLAMILACLATDTNAFALQNVEIQVAASASEIFVGESIDFQVVIQNSESPSAPDMSAIKELFDVAEMGNQSLNQSSITIINGRRSQNNSFSHVYQYRLTPKESGDLMIPSATATIDGQVVTSKNLPLRVRAPEVQDAVCLEVTTDQEKIYPTQPFTVTLNIWVQPLSSKRPNIDPLKPLRDNPPHLEINWLETPAGLSTSDKREWLQSMLSSSGVGFTLNEISTRSGGFFGGEQAAVFDLAQGRETRARLAGESIEYYKYVLKRTFTAEKAGRYTFGPATLKGTFAAEGLDDRTYLPKRIIAIAPALSVEVRDVPSPRPASFYGGIGEYRWAVSASPTKLRVGDPLTLILDVERTPTSGSLELISAPDLSSIPEIESNFDLIDKNPTGRMEGPIKRFSYAMRPKNAQASIPKLVLTSFDPKTESFVDTTTNAISLDVIEGAAIKSGDLVGAIPMTNSNEIKTRSEGIYQNVTDPTQLKNQHVEWRRWIQALIAIWLLSGTFVACVTFYQHRSADPIRQRKLKAKNAAMRRIDEAREALKRGDSQEAMRHVRASILGLVADTQNRVVDGLTASEVDKALLAVSVSHDDRQNVSTLLESIESAEYGAGKSSDPNATIALASELVTKIAPILGRGAS